MCSISSSSAALTELRAMGVRVLYGDGGFIPNQPGQGKPKEYPWHLLLDAAVRPTRNSTSIESGKPTGTSDQRRGSHEGV